MIVLFGGQRLLRFGYGLRAFDETSACTCRASDTNGDVAPLQELIGDDANQIGFCAGVSFRVPQQ